jgi:hypothetical protein
METTNYNPMTWDWALIGAQAGTFGLRLLGCLAILLVGYLVAKFLSRIVDRLLAKIGLDRMMERGGIKQAMSKSGYDASALVGKIIFYSLMLFVVAAALSVFGPNPISLIFSEFIAFFPNILVAIFIVVVAASLGSGVRDIVSAALGGLSYGKTIATASYVGILVLGVFMALNQLHIAPEILNGLWYAMLAMVVGVTVVAVGGGGVRPMEQRWQRALERADMEIPRMAETISSNEV